MTYPIQKEERVPSVHQDSQLIAYAKEMKPSPRPKRLEVAGTKEVTIHGAGEAEPDAVIS